ncbi:MAG: colanic acid biosynthesis glycosyltransferase WcaL [Candidatus Dadabacteria bacterium]|nr:MAG: colanic acid biosynthesis glycosyltransferase WcaL [Candidatus Dadabacteria bacterium]
MNHVAYLFPAFPVLHQTFTVGEVLGLRRLGYRPRLVSLKRPPASLQQDGARELASETFYCPPLTSREVLASFSKALWRRPKEVARLALAVYRAWKPNPRVQLLRSDGEPATLSLAERILAVYHTSALLYLLKSLALIPHAIYVAERLSAEGVRHVHAHWATYPTTVAFLIRRWSGIPYSFTAHAYDIYMHPRMLPAKVAEASFVVTCAEANKRYLERLCGACDTPIHVNYHGTDLARFRVPERRRDRCYRIASCGWLKEYKGFHILLEAVARLVDRGIDVRLDIAGDGPQRTYLERRAAELGIASRVTLHGFLKHQQLRELYKAADVFALPSVVLGRYGRQDVIPNVLAEAMAAGLPVVGSDIGGVGELIEHGVDGLLVPQRDVGALADALERIWREPELAARLGQAGRRKVEKIWDRERNIEQLARIFENYCPGDPEGLAA